MLTIFRGLPGAGRGGLGGFRCCCGRRGRALVGCFRRDPPAVSAGVLLGRDLWGNDARLHADGGRAAVAFDGDRTLMLASRARVDADHELITILAEPEPV